MIRTSFLNFFSIKGCTISQVSRAFDIPVDEFDGKVVYGEKRAHKKLGFKGHVEILEPSVKELIGLEKKIQLNYLKMKYNNFKDILKV